MFATCLIKRISKPLTLRSQHGMYKPSWKRKPSMHLPQSHCASPRRARLPPRYLRPRLVCPSNSTRCFGVCSMRARVCKHIECRWTDSSWHKPLKSHPALCCAERGAGAQTTPGGYKSCSALLRNHRRAAVLWEYIASPFCLTGNHSAFPRSASKEYRTHVAMLSVACLLALSCITAVSSGSLVLNSNSIKVGAGAASVSLPVSPSPDEFPPDSGSQNFAIDAPQVSGRETFICCLVSCLVV